MSAFTTKVRTTEMMVIISVCGLMMLTVSKDLLHSFMKHYSFYLSESMLFGLFWPLFIVFGLFIKKLISRAPRGVLFLVPFLFSICHIILFSFLVFSISATFFSHTFGMKRIFLESFADNILSCFLIYSSAVLLFRKKQKTNPKKRRFPGTIQVSHQHKQVLVACEEIVYLQTERPYIALVTHYQTYLHNSTLKYLQKEKLSDRFIRIHRSTIINIDFIRSYQSRHNGDYDVEMSNGDTLRVSRNYNAYFKSFTKNSGQGIKYSS